MSVLATRPTLRWAIPLGVAVAVFGVGAGATALRAAAGQKLPDRSAAQLLVDLQTAKLDGLSGTVVQKADLGLPAFLGALGGSGSASLTSLISGSHTLRVWYSGPDKARVALLGASGESDVIRNGKDVWVWSSNDKRAVHHTLSGKDATFNPQDPSSLLAATPEEAADKILAALDPSTEVTTAGTATVAGRSAYELVLSPRDSASLVNQVRLAVDGTEHLPLRVQVFAKGTTTPAFEVGFQQISFARPGNEQFTFTPPPGTTVEEGNTPSDRTPAETKPGGAPGAKPEAKPEAKPGAKPEFGLPGIGSEKTAVIGKAWTTVFVARVPQEANGQSTGNPLGAMLGMLPQVSGPWGSGRLFQSRLVTALLTDDGRLLVGAVTPEKLYQVAADPAAAVK